MEGHQLGGRYQLLERIGGGGMAIVYKAKDLVLHRQVAVKLLRPQFGTDEDFVQRFRREAQAVASLSHPNIVSVYDVGQEDETYYMVMEYIEGCTLKEIINAQGALPTPEAVRIATHICDALEHAHQNQIIHRDIKPHNILISKNGWVKVTDFGIARAVTSATITQTGSVLGSVHYFSPEQARGGVTGEKSDIYSLGIVLYEMLTGELPFSGDSPISIALMHLQEPLPEPRSINPDIPQSLENVVLKALVKDPFLRYGSAREMLDDLRTCLSVERQNEEKIVFSTDEDETRVFQAITPEMLEMGKQERAANSRANNGIETDEEETGSRKAWWKKSLLWVGGFALFCVLAVAGFIFALNWLYVPEVKVPRVEGIHVRAAEAKLKEANLVPVVVEQFSDKDVGIVVSQDPAPPMSVKENSSVTIVVSKGQQQIKMPNLMSLSENVAKDRLNIDKFTYRIEKRKDDSAPAGVVIEQFPAPDTLVVPSQTEVRLVVSEGKKEVKMPDIIGLDINAATVKLIRYGLDKGEVREEPSYEVQEPNIVLSTHPYDAGMFVEAGTKIPLVVSNGKLPADAKVSTIPIYVQLQENEQPFEVKIIVKDSRNKNIVAVQETVTESKQFNVDLVLAPDKNGTVQVYKNGELVENTVIEYRNLP